MRNRRPLVLAIGVVALAASTGGCGYIGAALLTVTARDDSGGGSGGPGGTLNANTAAEIVEVPRAGEEIQRVVVRLTDDEGDSVRLRLEFREDGVTDFRPARLARVLRVVDDSVAFQGPATETGELAASAEGIEYVLEWLWREDLGDTPRSSVTLRLFIVGTVDAPGGVAFTAEAQTIGNSRPIVSDVVVTGTGSVRVVRFKLRDSTSDRVRIEPTFTVVGEAERVLAPLDPATIVGLQTTPVDREFTFIWDTGDPTQIGARRVDVVVRIVAIDAGGLRSSPPEASPTFTVDNDRPTQALVTPPARATGGTVTISYVLVDPEEQLATIDATWEIEGVPPGPGTSGVATSVGGDGTTDLATSIPGAPHTFVWGYAVDLLNGNAATRVRFTIAPRGVGAIASAVSLLVGNDAPQAAIVSPAANASISGATTIEYTLFDTTADPAAVIAEFSTSGPGGPFLAAASASPVIGLATTDGAMPPGPRTHTYVWQTAANVPGAATVTFRITPTDGLAGSPGTPALRAFNIDNTAPAAPTLASVTPASGPTAGGTPVTILGTSFAGSTAITIGGAALVDPVLQSSTAITGRTPPGAAGAAEVRASTPGFADDAVRTDIFTYRDPPTIATVSPVDGPVAGGTMLTITGTGFATAAGATTVTLGGLALDALMVTSETTIAGRTPAAGGPGAASLVVTTAAGQAARAAAFRYLAVPDATAISPARGPLAGRSVTITGTGFASTDTQVLVDGAPLAAAAFTVSSDTTIAATLPSRAMAGAVDVVVATPGGTDPTPVSFAYLAAPTLAASPISPVEGPLAGGTMVTITGTGFVAGDTTVTLGGLALDALDIMSDTTIAGTTPAASAAGPANLVVTTPGGNAMRTGAFTYLAPLTIAFVSPGEGPTSGGTLVTVSGTGFRAGMGATTVTIDGNALTDVMVQSTQLLTGRTPAGTPGAKTVAVTTTTDGPVTLANGFTYRDTPAIAAITPVDGPLGGGTDITITGERFTADATVTIGGQPAAMTFMSATTLLATTPARGSPATVGVTVTTPAGQASLANAFTYLAPPNATAISPDKGPLGGRSVTITGTGFASSDTRVVVDGVTLGPGAVSVQSATTIAAALPAHSAGTVDVVVTTPGGADPTPVTFTYLPAPTLAAVNPIAPATGPTLGGTPVTITGTNFQGTGMTTETTVTIGGVPLVNLSVTSSTTITGSTPATPGLVAGARDVVVATAGGTATAAGAFTYADALMLTAISPDGGTPKGGTLVAIAGSGFPLGTVPAVTIGGAPATNVVVITTTLIAARTPPGTIGNPPAARDVVVAFPGGGGTATLPGGFSYKPTVSFNALTTRVLEDGALFGVGAPAVEVIIELDADPLASPVTFIAGVIGGSASQAGAGADYFASFPVPAGDFAIGARDGARASLTVAIFPDFEPEGDEDFIIGLALTSGDAILGQGTHRYVIQDDDVRFTSFTADQRRVEFSSQVQLDWTFAGSVLHPFLIFDEEVFPIFVTGSTRLTTFPFNPATLLGPVDRRRGYRITESSLLYGPGGGPPVIQHRERLEVDLARTLGVSSGAGGPSALVRGVATFPDGSAVVTGEFTGTLTLSGGAATPVPLTSAGDADIFVARLARNGDLVFAKRAGGPGRDAGRAIALLPDGTIVLVTEAEADAVFGPGEANQGSALSGGRLLVALFQGATGEFIRFRQANGAFALGESVSVFPDGSFVVAGRFSGTVTFDHATGAVVQLDSEAGSDDILVVRFRRDLTLQWAKRAGGSGADGARGVAALPDGRAVVVGSFEGTATFGPGEPGAVTLGPAGMRDGFVAAYEAGGRLDAAATAASAGDDEAVAVVAVPRGFAVTGTLAANATLIVTPLTGAGGLPLVGSIEPQTFIVRYGDDGSIAWAKASQSAGSAARPAGIVAFPDGSVAVAGTYEGGSGSASVTFSAGEPNETSFTSSSELAEMFVVRLQPLAGEVLSGVEAGGADADIVRAVAALEDGSVVIAGDFLSQPAMFGQQTTRNLIATDPSVAADLFLARYLPENYRMLEVRAAGPRYASSVEGGMGADPAATSRVNGVAPFADGGVVIAGGVRGTEQLVGGLAPVTLEPTGAMAEEDIFFARHDAFGFPVLGVRIGDAGRDEALAVASFQDGSFIIAGTFSGTVDFDPGAGVENLVASGSSDIFIAKYDRPGNLRFARRAGGPDAPGDEFPSAVATLPDGGFIVTGSLPEGTSTFSGPGAGAPTLTVPAGERGLFYARYAADGTPDPMAVKLLATIPSPGSIEARALSVRPSGDAYLTGVYTGDGVVQPSFGALLLMPPAAGPDGGVFLARLNPSGDVLDVRSATGASGNGDGQGVLALADGGAIATGRLAGTLTFGEAGGPGQALSSVTATEGDVFIVRYDSQGNIVFARTAGGAGDDRPFALAAHTDESFAVVGSFRGTATFDPAPGGTLMSPGGGATSDLFLARFRPDGTFVSARIAASGMSDFNGPGSAALLPDRSLAIGGTFDTAATFGPGATNAIPLPTSGIFPNGNEHLFVARFLADED